MTNQLKENIIKAIKRKDTSYLNGVLQVEKKIGKDQTKVLWLETKIQEIKDDRK